MSPIRFDNCGNYFVPSEDNVDGAHPTLGVDNAQSTALVGV